MGLISLSLLATPSNGIYNTIQGVESCNDYEDLTQRTADTRVYNIPGSQYCEIDAITPTTFPYQVLLTIDYSFPVQALRYEYNTGYQQNDFNVYSNAQY